MGFFSRWKDQKRNKFRAATNPYIEARNQVWKAERERLGDDEFSRRIQAVASYQIGQTPPSGFEEWQRSLDEAVQRRAHEIADGK